MNSVLRPLRFRMAALGFLAMYLPAILLLLATLANQESVEVDVGNFDDGLSQPGDVVVVVEEQIDWLPVLIFALTLAPLVAWVAWWLAGRALRPVGKAMTVQEELVAEASHELRTPLAVLTNNAEVLLAHPEPTVDLYRAGLQRSLTTSQSMTGTVESLLVDARARGRGVVREPLDLADVARAAIADVGPLAKKSEVSLRGEFEQEAIAPIDEPSVKRAITNLLANAIAASPPKATVTVGAAIVDGMAAVSVTDRGPGIEAENHELVFERFWKDGLNAGTGLGLPIARQVARAHGGDVTLESPVADGHGCRFRLVLPAVAAP